MQLRGTLSGAAGWRKTVASIADASARWPEDVAKEVHLVAKELTIPNRSRRFTAVAARERMQALVDTHVPPAPLAYTIEERECIICMSAPRHVRFACGHSAMCRGCLEPIIRVAAACLPALPRAGKTSGPQSRRA